MQEGHNGMKFQFVFFLAPDGQCVTVFLQRSCMTKMVTALVTICVALSYSLRTSFLFFCNTQLSFFWDVFLPESLSVKD